MKLVGVISTAVLSLTLVAAAPAYAQQEQHDQQEEQKAKPAQDEKKAQPAKSTKQEEKPAAQQEKNTKPAEKNAKQEEKNTKPAEQNAQQHSQQAQPGKQAQQSGRGRIPDDRFKANFGREHSFHVSQGDYNNHRFQYGGYSFGFVDPWPSNWLYTQDVYVVEINGVYYLCNPMYPGINITLSFAP
jgi:flagellar motor protein MotB